MRFTTVSGSVTELQPNEHLVYQSERENLHPILKREFDKGNIDFVIDPEFLDHAELVEESERVEWKTQGF